MFPLLSLASGPSGVPTPRPCESGANPQKEALVTHLLGPSTEFQQCPLLPYMRIWVEMLEGKKEGKKRVGFLLNG